MMMMMMLLFCYIYVDVDVDDVTWALHHTCDPCLPAGIEGIGLKFGADTGPKTSRP